MSPDQAGAIGIVAALAAMFLGMHVALAMAIVGMAGIGFWLSWSVGLESLAPTIFAKIGNYDLAVLPMFILMGQIMFAGGSGEKLYRVARAWLGHLPGGLAVATVVACAGFAAISGSAIATAATIGAFALPEMRKSGYPASLAGATVAASGTLGVLIPPSVTFIIYGILVNESIGTLFVAGIVPGVLLAMLFALVIVALESRRLASAARITPASWNERWRSLTGILDTLLLFVVVIGGMFAGVFTPNEAGAMGAAGALVICLLRRMLTREALWQAIGESAVTSAVVLFIIAGSAVLSLFLTVTRIPFTLADLVLRSDLPPPLVLTLIMLAYVVAGMVMEILPVIIITVPIFAPVVAKIGYDPIWFGVIIVLLGQMGMITPPVGVNVFVVKRMMPYANLAELFQGVWPFVGVIAALIAFLTIWKGSVMFFVSLFQ